ncbi:MAG: hypothetical protein RIT02_3181 [Planctomycetota bacterium]|jgi:hypothetical protein
MMMRSVFECRACVGMLLTCGLLLLQFGCSGSDAATPLSEPRTEVPQQWSEGGRLWQLTGNYGAGDDALLEKCFRQQPELVGSPDIAGQPLVFTSGASDRQYVWLRQAVDGTYWYSVRYAGSRFRIQSGQGVPWSSATEPSGVR